MQRIEFLHDATMILRQGSEFLPFIEDPTNRRQAAGKIMHVLHSNERVDGGIQEIYVKHAVMRTDPAASIMC